jgi:hypothetical protein
MRISQTTAEQISYKLTEKSRIAADELHKEFRELITVLYEEETPEAIKKAFSEYPDWFYTRSNIEFTGHGFRWESIAPTRPVICNKDNHAHLTLTAKISEKISKAKTRYDKANQEYKALRKETETALLNLRTSNNIKENIPAAIPFLPPPMSNALVVNVDSLNKKLNRQPEVKKPVKA